MNATTKEDAMELLILTGQDQPSETLIAVLKYCKTPHTSDKYTWRSLRDTLASLYHPEMRLVDVIEILTKVYEEALSDARFEMSSGSCLAQVLLAPIKGVGQIDWPYPKDDINTAYTIEQFYNAVIAEMLSELRFSRVDWLKL